MFHNANFFVSQCMSYGFIGSEQVSISKMIQFLSLYIFYLQFNPIALGKAKIVYNFGFSECSRTILAFLSALGLKH